MRRVAGARGSENVSTFQAVALGLIQGLTEFLPVSSSGHLILGSYLLGLPEPGLSLSVLLHLGTGFAVLVMLWPEISWIVRSLLFPKERKERGRALKLAVFVAAASVPAALVGIYGSRLIRGMFESGGVAAAGLMVTGLILRLSVPLQKGEGGRQRVSYDKPEPFAKEALYPVYRPGGQRPRRRYRRPEVQTHDMPSVRLGNALLVGLSQALAIVPGVSRSGITMTAGLLTGIGREDAARFSFLLSVPAVFGGALLDYRSFAGSGSHLFTVQTVLGTLAAFVAGLFALKTVFHVVRRGRLAVFSFYCLAVGFLSLLWLMLS